MPMTGMAVVGAQFRLKLQDRLLLQQQFLPWALRAGNNCHDLMTIYYEHHMEVRGHFASHSVWGAFLPAVPLFNSQNWVAKYVQGKKKKPHGQENTSCTIKGEENSGPECRCPLQ